MIEVKSGDYGYDLNFTIMESDKTTPKNLTGYTIYLKVFDKGNKILEKECTIKNATNGTCYYTVQDGGFVIQQIPYKDYEYELELQKTGEKLSTESSIIRVLRSI